MTKLEEVTPEHIENLDKRLELAMQRLRETALQLKEERDKYAAVLHRIRREVIDVKNLPEKHEATIHWIIGVTWEVLEDE